MFHLHACKWKLAHAQGPTSTCPESAARSSQTAGVTHPDSFHAQVWGKALWKPNRQVPHPGPRAWHCLFPNFCSLPAYLRSRWPSYRFPAVSCEPEFGTQKEVEASRSSKTVPHKKELVNWRVRSFIGYSKGLHFHLDVTWHTAVFRLHFIEQQFSNAIKALAFW